MTSLRDRWIAALRSGEYEQGYGALREIGGYCCLGVLADLINPHGWTSCGGWRLSYTGLPREVLPTFTQDRMADRNDGAEPAPDEEGSYRPWTFDEIADYIEQHPEIDPKHPEGDNA